MIQAEKLRAAAGGAVLENEPMSQHTTFRVGGPADYFVTPADEQALAAVIACCREAGEPYYLIGNGSNILVADSGYRGVIIRMGQGMGEIRSLPGNILRAGAGALLSVIAKEARDRSLAGFAFAAGIPGSLGGACVMNAGAYGGEMKQVLRTVRVLAPEGDFLDLPADQLDLGYRHSNIPERGYTAVRADIQLEPGNRAEIGAMMDDLAGRRREKQPLEYPSAGSTFKRPEGYFAGKLIQDAGLRGFRVGGAQVSEKHCGFVINRDHASSADIYRLIHEVQARVFADSGVRLEPEVKFLGFAEDAEDQRAES